MKIRFDFVTNSSSSSFTCVALYSKELYDFLQKLIAENKYIEQADWTGFARPEKELHLDWTWEELSFDKRWYKVQTTEEYGATDKESIYKYVSRFFNELSAEEEGTLKELIYGAYETKEYQTKKYKDSTDGFVGFNFNELKKKASEKKEIKKEEITEAFSFDNPEIEYFKEKAVNTNEIDFEGKTVCLHVVDLLLPGDDEHKYYENRGSAFDVATVVIEQYYGGKVTKTISANTDYVIISSRMRVKGRFNQKKIIKEYEDYSDYQAMLKNMIIDSDEKRISKKKDPIGIIFENDFYAWLHNQYDALKNDSDYFKPIAKLIIRLEPFGSRGWNTWSFKSEYLGQISREEFEQYIQGSNSVAELISAIENSTKPGCFSMIDNSQYENMMDYARGDTFRDYEKIFIKYNATDGIKYQIVIEREPVTKEIKYWNSINLQR